VPVVPDVVEGGDLAEGDPARVEERPPLRPRAPREHAVQEDGERPSVGVTPSLRREARIAHEVHATDAGRQPLPLPLLGGGHEPEPAVVAATGEIGERVGALLAGRARREPRAAADACTATAFDQRPLAISDVDTIVPRPVRSR
jgi:hypothetical protein